MKSHEIALSKQLLKQAADSFETLPSGPDNFVLVANWRGGGKTVFMHYHTVEAWTTQRKYWECSYNGNTARVHAATPIEAACRAHDELHFGHGFLDLDQITVELITE